MRYLLDTHTFLWLASGHACLGESVKNIFLEPSNEIFLSIGSAWEIAIKCSLGKLKLGRPLRTLLEIAQTAQNIRLLPIKASHVCAVEGLPFHHRDPFDRVLIAQALAEGLTVLGRDDIFEAYGVTRVW